MLQCFAFCRLPQETKKRGHGPSLLIFLFAHRRTALGAELTLRGISAHRADLHLRSASRFFCNHAIGRDHVCCGIFALLLGFFQFHDFLLGSLDGSHHVGNGLRGFIRMFGHILSLIHI